MNKYGRCSGMVSGGYVWGGVVGESVSVSSTCWLHRVLHAQMSGEAVNSTVFTRNSYSINNPQVITRTFRFFFRNEK